jgi:hypothetical protein
MGWVRSDVSMSVEVTVEVTVGFLEEFSGAKIVAL